jgi:hypothetical protein
MDENRKMQIGERKSDIGEGVSNAASSAGVCSLMRKMRCANMALIVAPTLTVRG